MCRRLGKLKFVEDLVELAPDFDDDRTAQAAAVVGWRPVGLAMTSMPSSNVAREASAYPRNEPVTEIIVSHFRGAVHF